MNSLVSSSSVLRPGDLPPARVRPEKDPKFPTRGLVDRLKRSPLLDSRISYLKILAMSLLREIASAENMDEDRGSDTIDLQSEVRRFETELIRSALIQTGGRQRQAARLLGTKVTTLNTKIKRYGISVEPAPDYTD